MAEELRTAEEEQHHHLPPDPTKMTEAADEKKALHKQEATAGRRRYGYAVTNSRGTLSAFIFTILVLAGITALIVWLVYRPHKPKFKVVSAAVYQLNTTTTAAASPPSYNFITTTMQFTVVTRNSNRRVSFSYDHLSAYVSYRNQAITPPVALPDLFHNTKSTVALSPVVGGNTIPVAAEVSNALTADQDYGAVGLRLVVTGRLRYKAGAIWTRRYGVYVRCDLLVGLRRGFVGQVPLLGSQACTVDT